VRPFRGSWLIAAVALVLTLCLIGLEMARRRNLYWYDVSADYQYGFESGDVQRIPVRLSAEGVTLPKWDGEWQTALIRLKVSSGIPALWFEPSIDVQAGSSVPCRQFFERGAKGLRYANLCLSSRNASPGDLVRLEGMYLDWEEQEAELLLFSVPDLENARILVLAPHPDDAEIASFGFYGGRQTWIVTVTTGSYGGGVYGHLVSGIEERETMQATLRVWNSLTVPRLGGVSPERALNLGYSTLTLEAMYREPDTAIANPFGGSTDIGRWRAWNSSTLLADRHAEPTWWNLVGDLEHLIREIRPDIVVAPHPKLDESADHRFTTAALLSALERLGDPPLHLFLYSVHHPLSHFMPAGPAGAAVTLLPWFESSTPFRAVYSHPLDAHAQVAKLFALEAMHDLRGSPVPVVHGPFGDAARRFGSLFVSLLHDPGRELSFFRRAVRSTELFLVYPASDRELLQRLGQ
jgi:LmbE family N-acetylglucosaminyl deacetylase